MHTVPYGSICCTYHQLNYSSPNRSNNTKKDKSRTIDPTFWKMEVYGKRGRENGPKTDKDKTKRATGLGRRTLGEIQIAMGADCKLWELLPSWFQKDGSEAAEVGVTGRWFESLMVWGTK